MHARLLARCFTVFKKILREFGHKLFQNALIWGCKLIIISNEVINELFKNFAPLYKNFLAPPILLISF